MDRRDRRQLRAAGAAGERRRARMPGFLASEEEDSEDEGQLLGRRRVRRLYDEPYGEDDAGFDEVCATDFSSFQGSTDPECADEQEMPIEQLSDIRADSLAQWIEEPRTRKTIMREFKNFLLTYTDDNNESVYGSRITQLGQRASCSSVTERARSSGTQELTVHDARARVQSTRSRSRCRSCT